jgi:hypothetical protein
MSNENKARKLNRRDFLKVGIVAGVGTAFVAGCAREVQKIKALDKLAGFGVSASERASRDRKWGGKALSDEYQQPKDKYVVEYQLVKPSEELSGKVEQLFGDGKIKDPDIRYLSAVSQKGDSMLTLPLAWTDDDKGKRLYTVFSEDKRGGILPLDIEKKLTIVPLEEKFKKNEGGLVKYIVPKSTSDTEGVNEALMFSTNHPFGINSWHIALPFVGGSGESINIRPDVAKKVEGFTEGLDMFGYKDVQGLFPEKDFKISVVDNPEGRGKNVTYELPWVEVDDNGEVKQSFIQLTKTILQGVPLVEVAAVVGEPTTSNEEIIKQWRQTGGYIQFDLNSVLEKTSR